MRRWVLASVLLALSVSASATDITINGNTYTLQGHPRVLLDGPDGEFTARVKDPDGAGPLVAPQATDSNLIYVSLKDWIRSCRAAPTYCNVSSDNEQPFVVLAGALDWYMDNSQVESLAMAKYWLANVETWIESTDSWACDIREPACGHASWHSWPPFSMAVLAQVYTLIQSEMSAGEKLAFYQKMFNDDTYYYEDGCDNMLQRIEPVTGLSYTSGSTTLTGVGFTGNVSPGDRLYYRPSGTNPFVGWATVATVPSDVSLTLTGPFQSSVGSNITTQSGGKIYIRNAWTSTSCGLVWAVAHHHYTNPQVFGRVGFTHTSSYTSASTSITVSSTAGLPPPPFYIRATFNNETMRVTAVNGLVLTVERGGILYGGAAQNGGFPPSGMQYSPYAPNDGFGDYGDNNPLQNNVGLMAISLALADEGPEARKWITRVADSWIQRSMPIGKDLLTGFSQSGGTTYGAGRWGPGHVTMITHMLKQIPSGSSPSLDFSGGHWLKYFAEGWLYIMLPGHPTTNMGWGQPGIGESAFYYAHIWPYTQTAIFGDDFAGSSYWNYWARNLSGHFGSREGSDERHIPYSLMFWLDTDAAVDHRTVLPTERAFNLSDGNPGKALQMWVSRTGWTSSSDTLVFANMWGVSTTADHIGTSCPGGYKIYKGGYQITDNSADNIGQGNATNMIFFGTSFVKASPSAVLLDRANADTASPSSWAYSRVNTTGAYVPSAAVTRVIRNMVHFKKPSSQDYVVVYDTAATSVAKTISQNMHFDKTSGESSTMTDSTLPSLTWTGPSRRMNTAVVLPSGTGVAGTYINGTNVHRVALCASTDGSTCAAATSAEFLVVHMPTVSAVSTMPTTSALGTIDSDFVGVQIEDATAPSVAIFSKLAADQTASSFTTTHSGTARYVVTGLSAGAYDVVRGGVTTVLDDHVVDTSGSLTFESVAGAFTVSQGTPPPPDITITTTSLPNHVEDVAGYSQQLAYTGGTGAVTWTLDSGTWCAGITMTTGGLVSGTPTTQQTCNMVVKITDSLAQFDTQALSITITAPPPACVITTTSLPDGVRSDVYTTQVLGTSGCTAPLAWTTTPSDFCPGLVIGAANGEISGTPTVVGTCDFSACVEDDDAEADCQGFSVTIDPPAPAVLNITTTSPLSDCVQHQACSTTFEATGGTPPYTWTKASGTYCVGNSSLSGATLSGAPTTVETCTFTMQVEDDDSATDTQEFERTITSTSATLLMQAIPGSNGVILKFGTAAMNGSQECDITINDEEINPDTLQPYGVVATGLSSSGRSTRVVALGGLAEEHQHTAIIVCGTVASGSVGFLTSEAVGGTISWQYTAVPSAGLQARSAAKLTVEAVPANGGSTVTATNASCGSGCTVTLGLESGDVYTIRHIWKTAGDSVLATTSYAPIVVP